MKPPGLAGPLKTTFCKGSDIPSGRTQVRITDFKQKVVKNLGALMPEFKPDAMAPWNLSRQWMCFIFPG